MMARTEKSAAADVRLGEAIRSARLALRMSQETLGKALSVSFQQVQKYEKGTNRVSAVRLVEIARVLKVPATHLIAVIDHGRLPGGNNGGELSAIQKMLTDRDVQKIATVVIGISDRKTRLALVELVRATAKLA